MSTSVLLFYTSVLLKSPCPKKGTSKKTPEIGFNLDRIIKSRNPHESFVK
jgi:hypothetical protein